MERLVLFGMVKNTTYSFDDPKIDYSVCGGKGASLAKLSQAKFPVPRGFIITATVYEEYIKTGVITQKHKDEIFAVFDELKLSKVAVRSSAVAEDSAENSFAGQLETFLNQDRAGLIEAIIGCYKGTESSHYKSYTADKNIGDNPVAVVVQQMVASEAAGVGFSRNPLTGTNEVIIEASFGLGEAVVQGAVDPDRFIIDPKSLDIKQKNLAPRRLWLKVETMHLQDVKVMYKILVFQKRPQKS